MHLLVHLAFYFLLCFYWKKPISECLFSFSWIWWYTQKDRETSWHPACSRQCSDGSNPLFVSIGIKNQWRHNDFTDVGARSNDLCLTLLPYRPCPKHLALRCSSCFTFGTSTVCFVTVWFASLDSCQVPISSERMLSLSARVNKCVQPKASAAREKWRMLSWWQKWPYCQKSEESFPGYSSLQIHWSNCNPQIKTQGVIYWLFCFGDWALESKNAAPRGATQGLEEVGCIFFHLKLREVNSWWKWGGDWWLWKLQGPLPMWDSFGTNSELQAWPCPLWPVSNLNPDLGRTTLLLGEEQLREWGRNLSGDQVKIILFSRRRQAVSLWKLDVLLVRWYSWCSNLMVLRQH